jgi:nucleoid-associated protein YgaU
VRQAERHCSAPVRRLAATALGVTLGAGLAVPTLATADPPPRPVSLSGLTLPDRTTGVGLATTARPAIGRQATSPRPPYVDVRPGDSLWRIARSLLGPAATDVEITHVWHRIHRLNLDRIGADPDLIRPGTRLTVPPLAQRKEAR